MRQETRSLFSRPVPAALFLLALLVVAGAALVSGTRALRDGRHLVTGGARWIWLTLAVDEPRPVHFYLRRDFTLAGAPPSAKAMVFVDRRGALTVNGSRFPLPEQRPGSPLAVVDVGSALVEGANRIVIEAGSPNGAGGVLFHLELPDGTRVDSDSAWRVGLSESELARGGGVPAGEWGRPPMYPWGYPKTPSG